MFSVRAQDMQFFKGNSVSRVVNVNLQPQEVAAYSIKLNDHVCVRVFACVCLLICCVIVDC